MIISIDVFKEAADQLGITYKQIFDTPLVSFSHQGLSVIIDKSHTSAMSVIGYTSCNEKHISKRLLRAVGLNTPKWQEFYEGSTEADIRKYCKNLNFPVVIKPFRGSHGRDISVGVTNIDTVVPIVQKLQREYSIVIVEEYFEGTEIRLIATRKQFLAATLRRPASVLGDGKSSIRELVKKENDLPHRHASNTDKVLRQLRLDEPELETLKEFGYSPDDVPEKDCRILLRRVSNISAGGDSIDVTTDVHPSVQQIAIDCVNAIPELPFGGVDFISIDYTTEQTARSYTVVEINSNPMIGLQRLPYLGESRNVAVAILKEIFPNASS